MLEIVHGGFLICFLILVFIFNLTQEKRFFKSQLLHNNERKAPKTLCSHNHHSSNQALKTNPPLSSFNIPGWAVTVIKQAVLLLGCRDLHFLQRLGSAHSFLG